MTRRKKLPFDPREVLAQIAQDAEQSPVHRLRAAKALLAGEPRKRRAEPEAGEADPVIRRAVELNAGHYRGQARMPIAEHYRGVAVHRFQPPDRIAGVVQPALDAVLAEPDAAALTRIAGDITQAPEARLLARDKYAAMREVQADKHGARLSGLEDLDARVAGLASLRWANPDRYASLLDVWPPGHPGPVQRPAELAKELATASRAAHV